MSRIDDARDALGNLPEQLPAREPEAEQLFDALRLRASGVVSREDFDDTWRPACGWALEEGGARLVIAVPSAVFVAWFRARWMGQLASCARELGREGLEFRFIVVDELAA